ncbi:hypothetical protein SDC9_141520 [bioreactor metagenome]|uniref:Uncharacterized protein n=1 Tax=bioreactor metagenome TaxID=1076179 RepID=A0A645DXW8_9ZZZZ
MHRETDRARLVHDRTLDVLADPPGRIGGKTEATLGVELFQCVNQAEITLLDKIQQRDAPIQIVLGNIDHKAQVALDHGLSGLEIALTDTPCQRGLLIRSQQRIGPDLVQINLRDIAEELVLDDRRLSVGEHFHLEGKVRIMTLDVVRDVRLFHGPPRQRAGRYFIGSTGCPCLRISK